MYTSSRTRSSSTSNALATLLEPSEDEIEVEAQLRAWQAEMRAERLRRLTNAAKVAEARVRHASPAPSPLTSTASGGSVGRRRASQPRLRHGVRRPTKDVATYRQELDAVGRHPHRRDVQTRQRRREGGTGGLARVDPNEVEFHAAQGLLHDYIHGRTTASSLSRRQQRVKELPHTDAPGRGIKGRGTQSKSGAPSHPTPRAAATPGASVASGPRSGHGEAVLPHSVAPRAAESRLRTRSAGPAADKTARTPRAAGRTGRLAQATPAASPRTASRYQRVTRQPPPPPPPSERVRTAEADRSWRQVMPRTSSSIDSPGRTAAGQREAVPKTNAVAVAHRSAFKPRLRYGHATSVAAPATETATGRTISEHGGVADSAPLQRHVWSAPREPARTTRGATVAVSQSVAEPPDHPWRSHFREVVALLSASAAPRGSLSIFARQPTARPLAGRDGASTPVRSGRDDSHDAAVATDEPFASVEGAATGQNTARARWCQTFAPSAVTTGDRGVSNTPRPPVAGLLFDRLIATRGGTAAYGLPSLRGDVTSSADSSATSRKTRNSSRH